MPSYQTPMPNTMYGIHGSYLAEEGVPLNMQHTRLLNACLLVCSIVLMVTTGCAPNQVKQEPPVTQVEPHAGPAENSIIGPSIFWSSSFQEQINASSGNGGENSTATDSTPPKAPMVHMGSTGTYALYLNQALAALHYMPVTFTPDQTATGGKSAINTLAANASTESPVKGTFSWSFPSLQPTLGSLWNPSTFTVITEGALMTYQQQRGLSVDGTAGPQVWQSLQTDLAASRLNPHGYVNVTVEKELPETLKVWVNGSVVYTSLANTGIAAAPTDSGTWPVYIRYQSQTMQGRTPSGEYYSDAGVPWVSYFHGGDAVHGFIRPSYGYPQSLGCVELPTPNAKVVYNLITYGTLVTVCTKLP